MPLKEQIGKKKFLTDARRLATAMGVAAAGGTTPHNLLGNYHTDTETNAPSEGALVLANATSKWDVLLHPDAAGYAMVTDATTWLADQTPTWTGTHTWDDGAGDSPANAFVGGSNDDTFSMWLEDDAVAGDSDFVVKFPAADTDSQLIYRDSGDVDVGYVDADGNGWFAQHVGLVATPVPESILLAKDSALSYSSVDFSILEFDGNKTGGASGSSDDFYGVNGRARMNQSGGTIGELRGIDMEARIDRGSVGESGTIRSMQAALFKVDANGGTVWNDVNGMQIRVDLEAAFEVKDDVKVINVWGDNDATTGGTAMGIYLDLASGFDWAIYSDNSYPSAHQGAVTVGNTNVPGAQLDVDQNSATGAVPVLKLDQGDASEELILASYEAGDVNQRIIVLDNTAAAEFGWTNATTKWTFTDNVALTDGDLYLPTLKGVIHADGVTDGQVLVADGTRYVPGDLSDITGGDATFVVMSLSGTLANERQLTAGDGIDLTDGGAGSLAVVAVDVTDILGSGLTESLNNIDLDWGTPTIGTIEPDDAASAGVSTNPTRSDHQHAIVCAAPITTLDGSTPNAEGSATSFARSDHTHDIDASGFPVPPSARGHILRGEAGPVWASYNAATLGAVLIGDGTDIISDTTPTFVGNVTLDDGAGNPPFLLFVGGTNDDTARLWLNDNATAGYSDFLIRLPGATAESRFIIESSSGADKAWIDALGDASFRNAYLTAMTQGSVLFSGASGLVSQDNANLFWDDSNNRLGIGTNGPSHELHVYAATTPRIYIESADTNGGELQLASSAGYHVLYELSADLRFYDGTTDQMALLSGGELIVGGVSADTNPTYDALMHTIDGTFRSSVEYSASVPGGAMSAVTYGANAAAYSRWAARRARGTRASPTATQSGDVLARIGAGGYGATAFASQSTAFMEAVANQNFTDAAQGTYLYFATTPDASTTPVERMRLDDSGMVLINETANAQMTIGLTINQAANDDEILAFKSSDANHGMTDLAETDTFGFFVKPGSGADGGLGIRGLSDVTQAVSIFGLGVTDDTTKTTAGRGYVELLAGKKSGTGAGNVGSDANMVVIRNYGTTRFIFDAEGSGHSDIEWTTFDEHDDLALLDSLEASFGQFAEGHRGELERLGIARYDERGGHAMVNWTRLSMLLVGATRQIGQRLDRYERALVDLGVNPAQIGA